MTLSIVVYGGCGFRQAFHSSHKLQWGEERRLSRQLLSSSTSFWRAKQGSRIHIPLIYGHIECTISTSQSSPPHCVTLLSSLTCKLCSYTSRLQVVHPCLRENTVSQHIYNHSLAYIQKLCIGEHCIVTGSNICIFCHSLFTVVMFIAVIHLQKKTIIYKILLILLDNIEIKIIM